MKFIYPVFVVLSCANHVSATSVKMDFLPVAHVRTDPIINPDCLSDHVHTFYGPPNVSPDTTYDDLIASTQNSGNVEENKSLYWHPSVYNYNHDTDTFELDDIWFASAYYIWTTGEATAFPDGFKMVAGLYEEDLDLVRANAECVDPSPCEKSNCETTNDFFPETACSELEVSMAFPSCWDGVNIDSENHRDHVSYDIEGGSFDGDCPESHPVKIPEIQFFFRILNYDGGRHEFSDGSGMFHADYFSGWESIFLQELLDECCTCSTAANPDSWCEEILTFRDAPKEFGDDMNIVEKLEEFQPNPGVDTTEITDEAIDNLQSYQEVHAQVHFLKMSTKM
eukprot:CAMPEP_0178939864 /NCGR_PEP_ID=MMETSP0789-20121207/462_1 /TAXON_ID=3005 /ORGANISM="Rhizosolenia setigera, Strain CCMP 1694" /LENGTH=337 /DNA_ID=CAMNT_0020618783 /DNA_START=133 /DNA_END=1146 /DNA_ORIENTATION=-